MSSLFLAHHGVKDQRWGIRHYQNPDGTWTEEGKERRRSGYRVITADKTRKDVNSIVRSLDKRGKHFLNVEKGYLSYEEGQYLVKRFLAKDGDKPVAFLDVLSDGKDEKTNKEYVNIAIAVNQQYQGKGYGYEVAKKGSDWLKKNRSKFEDITWSAYTDNLLSRKLAEKSGFKFDPETSGDKYANYGFDDERRYSK